MSDLNWFSTRPFRQVGSNLPKVHVQLLLIASLTLALIFIVFQCKHASFFGDYVQIAENNIQTSSKKSDNTEDSATLKKHAKNKKKFMLRGETNFLTISFSATCGGSGLSNRLYEFVSLHGIARTVQRIPYVNLFNDCMLPILKEMESFFPNLVDAFDIELIHSGISQIIKFAPQCCVYDDVSKLLLHNGSQFVQLSTIYLQSYKYFDKYKSEILKLLAFTKEDSGVAEQLAIQTFQNDKSHRICVHIRRGDYLRQNYQQWSTEEFTRSAVIYLRNKIRKDGENSIVALLGDDRTWAQDLFANESWFRIPTKTERPTTDYAFFARHCQTILLTASASTFGFWSAYLSSAQNVYYNREFANSDQFRNEFNPADVFPRNWIALAQNKFTLAITEQ